jgi:hypothetical protein
MAGTKEAYLKNHEALDRATIELYQSFMAGYVRRINDATFRVAIGGIRVGSAKYSRLAQINLKTRIMTFSRYAIENVPERGRRYLVLHELAHIKEASHNRRFWQLVANFEPDYKQISRDLELAFKENVKEDAQKKSGRKPRRLFHGLIMPGEDVNRFNIKVNKISRDEPMLVPLSSGQAISDWEKSSSNDHTVSKSSPQLIESVPIFQQLTLFD